MTVYFFAAWAGGLATAALLWSHGALLAIACAPLGGSVAGLLVAACAVLVSSLRARLGREPVATRRTSRRKVIRYRSTGPRTA